MEKQCLSKEEKLAIIKEAEDSSNISAVLRKYGIAPSLFYKWKHRYLAEGLEGLAPRYRSRIFRETYSSHKIDQMLSENQRLKKMVAEKELQIELLQEVLKKKNKLGKGQR